MEKKKILLVGRWGKTHAFAKAIKEKSKYETQLYCYMDKPNVGLVSLATDYRLGDMMDNDKIIEYALEKQVDFAIAVPHMALSNRLTDDFIEKGIRCIGPTEKCSRLETDKSFLREILEEINPGVSPLHKRFNNEEDIIEHIKSIDYEFAVKPAGVTEGDGVKVIGIQLKNKDEAIDYVDEIFKKNIGGIATVIIEEKLVGREYTIQAFIDGETARSMPATRDYKLLYEGDKGLNTPGMGSISFPDHLLPFLNMDEYIESLNIMTDVIRHLSKIYREIFVGFLSGQFIKTSEGIKVIEFNVRPGDSEILNIVPILGSDFVDICEAMIDMELGNMHIEYENKATVCKYIVNRGFPNPKDDIRMTIDEEGIKDGGGDLFYSCFKVEEDVYKPSPRGVAITTRGDTLEEAYLLCEKLIEENIKGEDIWHRKDIGTKDLLDKYVLE